MNEPVKKPLTPEELEAKIFSNKCGYGLDYLTKVCEKLPTTEDELKGWIADNQNPKDREKALSEYEEILEWLIANHNVTSTNGMVTIDGKNDGYNYETGIWGIPSEPEEPPKPPVKFTEVRDEYLPATGIYMRLVNHINENFEQGAAYLLPDVISRLVKEMPKERPSAIRTAVNGIRNNNKYMKLVRSGVATNDEGETVRVMGAKMKAARTADKLPTT